MAATPIQMVFIRHGKKDTSGRYMQDKDRPLDERHKDGKQAVLNLAKRLKSLNITPDVYITSCHKHAEQTSELLAQYINPSPVIGADALTPDTKEENFTIENIIASAAEKKVNLESMNVIACVGHEPRLSKLITLITGTRIRPLDQVDAVCVEAEDLQQAQLGCGKIIWRIPVRAYEEDKLRAKVTSKMTVATFLAGFTFTALMAVLMDATTQLPTLEKLSQQTDLAALAKISVMPLGAICLTLATALFIATVYIYDRLSMPEGFWNKTAAPNLSKMPKLVRDNKDENGILYGYMIYAWTRLFTFGVIAAALGFLLIILAKSQSLVLLFIAVILVVVICYRRIRPELGVD